MAEAEQELRTAAFGTLDGGPWGVIWDFGPTIALLAPAPGQPLHLIEHLRISPSTETGDWLLEGDGLELRLSGEGERAEVSEEQELTGFDQLSRVAGQAALGGTEMTIDCPGVRGVWSALALGEFESLRRACAWFEGGEAVALLAVRPRKARGHGRDLVSGSVFETTGAKAVSEPRLSTTYDRAGVPTRAGLELWVDAEDDRQYSRRAAGQSLASATEIELEPLSIHADLFRWQSRGSEGIGVYVLAERR